jgi:hypothetical protein
MDHLNYSYGFVTFKVCQHIFLTISNAAYKRRTNFEDSKDTRLYIGIRLS